MFQCISYISISRSFDVHAMTTGVVELLQLYKVINLFCTIAYTVKTVALNCVRVIISPTPTNQKKEKKSSIIPCLCIFRLQSQWGNTQQPPSPQLSSNVHPYSYDETGEWPKIRNYDFFQKYAHVVILLRKKKN